MSASQPTASALQINFKGILANFCQTTLRRSCNKHDIAYTTGSYNDQFRSTVKLNCLEGQEAAGAPCKSKKEAEQAAAQQALLGMASIPAVAKEALSSQAFTAKSGESKEAPKSTSQGPKKGKAIDASIETSNPKNELITFLQLTCSRSMTREDIIFDVVEEGRQFKATVRLVCMGGKSFEGDVCPNRKSSEQSAARRALSAYHSEIEELNTKRKDASSVQGSLETAARGSRTSTSKNRSKTRKAIDITGEYSNPKTELTSFCQMKCNKCMGRDDVLYTVAHVDNMSQATVKLVCLGGEEWVGEARPTPKQAEFSAALQVLKAYEDEIASFNTGALPWTGEPRPKVDGAEEPGDKAKSPSAEKKQKKKEHPPSGPGLPREKVDVGVQMGEILEWKSTYGWIKSHVPIEHAAAKKHRGRIYVHQIDVQGEVSSMVKGCIVQFSVYEDASGLGATDVVTV